MILREIVLEESEQSKRLAIQRNVGQQVILEDEHNNWCHGTLLPDECKDDVYQMQIADSRGKRQLHYHDLKQLLFIANHPKYRRPEIKP